MSTVQFDLKLNENDRFHYPCRELCQQFEPEADVVFSGNSDRIIIICRDDAHLTFSYRVRGVTTLQKTYVLREATLAKETFKGFLYYFLTEVYGRRLKWGDLTGIKPVKIAHKFLKEGKTGTEAIKALQIKHFISKEKAALITGIAQNEMSMVYPTDDQRISIYVGIPVCVSKCGYCSFVTTTCAEGSDLLEQYFIKLLEELVLTIQLMKNCGLVTDTLYIGGGTPAILSTGQIERLFNVLEDFPGYSHLREMTFEGGRPDVMTEEKLTMLSAMGVSRLCINPQSMNDRTLAAVGRIHTEADIRRIFKAARKLNFHNINMDLIVGLNHESPNDFRKSLSEVIALEPENITIHNLALKKGSKIKEIQGRHVESPYDEKFYRQIEKTLQNNQYTPYYLYRQKYTQGNGENVGYCLPGKAGIYNILMMAERQTILGIGAGSSGKLYTESSDQFTKVFTVKDVTTYINRFDEMMERKFKSYQKHFLSGNHG